MTKKQTQVPSLQTIGSELAENILIEFTQAKNMDDIEKIASSHSETIAKYTHQLSDIGNQVLLEALLMKFLVAGVPEENEKEKAA